MFESGGPSHGQTKSSIVQVGAILIHSVQYLPACRKTAAKSHRDAMSRGPFPTDFYLLRESKDYTWSVSFKVMWLVHKCEVTNYIGVYINSSNCCIVLCLFY